MVANLKRLIAVYLFGVGAIVAIHFLITRFYDPTWEDASLAAWSVINPLQVIAVALTVAVTFLRKRSVCAGLTDQTVTREYLEANVLFYFSVPFLLALLWNWFGVQFADPAHSSELLWIFIDVTLPVLLGVTGHQLLSEASGKAG